MKKLCKLIPAATAAEILSNGMSVVLTTGKAPDHIKVSDTTGHELGYLAKDLSSVSSYTSAKDLAGKLQTKHPAILNKVGRSWSITVELKDETKSVYVVGGGQRAVFAAKSKPTKPLAAKLKSIRADVETKRNAAAIATGADKARAEAELAEAEAALNGIGKDGQLPLTMALAGEKYFLMFEGEACCMVMPETDTIFVDSKKVCQKQGIEVISAEQLATLINGNSVDKLSASIVNGLENYSWLIKISIPMSEASAAVDVLPTVDLEELMDDMDPQDSDALSERVVYLKKVAPSMPDSVMKKFVERLSTHKGISPFKPTFVDGKANYIGRCVSAVVLGMNLRLVGPAGCGKNRLVETLQSLFDVGISDMAFNADTNQDALLGTPTVTTNGDVQNPDVINNLFNRLLNVMGDKNALATNPVAAVERVVETVPDVDWTPLLEALKSDTAVIKFQLSDIMEKAQEPALINFDEVNMAAGYITALLHPLTDHRRYINVPGYGTVHLNPEAFIVCTMNEEYEGTKTLNRAFRDRFITVRFKPSQSISQILKSEVPGLDAAAAKSFDDLYKRIQKDIGSQYSEDTLSLRSFIRAAQLRVAGYSIKDSLMLGVVEDIDELDDRTAIEAFIETMKEK